MTSWLVIFRAFLFIFFCPPDPKSEKKNPRKSTNKKILALLHIENSAINIHNITSWIYPLVIIAWNLVLKILYRSSESIALTWF